MPNWDGVTLTLSIIDKFTLYSISPYQNGVICVDISILDKLSSYIFKQIRNRTI